MQLEPQFMAESSDAEVYFHSTVEEAIADKEFTETYFSDTFSATSTSVDLRKSIRSSSASARLRTLPHLGGLAGNLRSHQASRKLFSVGAVDPSGLAGSAKCL